VFHVRDFSWHRYHWHLIGGCILTVLLGVTGRYAYQSLQIPEGKARTIIVGQTVMHEGPDRLSPQVAILTYGQQVLAIPKKSPKVFGGWTEVYLDRDRSGFVKDSTLGTPEIMETFRGLKQSIAGMEPQASGVTTAPTYLRLEPGREGKVIEKLPKGTRFEVFQRQAAFPKRPNEGFIYAPIRKEVWYKVRLADNRVGYIFTKNFKLEPPFEILKYTQFRRVMAWLKLRTVTGESFGSVPEYLVAYASQDGDFGADFDRIEAYFWDGDRYQTALVLRSLRGILPIRVVRQDKETYFEFTELDPAHKKQVIVQRYPYAYPFKKVGSTTLQEDVGLH
jgi:hypothetical protein